MHAVKTRHGKRTNRRIGAACDHHISVASANHPTGLPDTVESRGAGAHVRHVGAFKTGHDGQLPGNHIDDAARNQKGRNTARTAIKKRLMIIGNHRDAADARTYGAANAAKVFALAIKAAVANRLESRRDAEMNEAVEPSGFLHGHIGRDIKVFHFGCDLAAKVRCVKTRHRPHAANTLHCIFPNRLHIIADRTDGA